MNQTIHCTVSSCRHHGGQNNCQLEAIDVRPNCACHSGKCDESMCGSSDKKYPFSLCAHKKLPGPSSGSLLQIWRGTPGPRFSKGPFMMNGGQQETLRLIPVKGRSLQASVAQRSIICKLIVLRPVLFPSDTSVEHNS